MELNKKIIRVGILTISDTRTSSASNIQTFDFSGHNLKELINKFNVIESAKVIEYECIIDDIKQIQAKMIEWCSERKVDILLTTGGTGFSPRDVTPEATLGVVQKLTPGISQAIMNVSLKITPMAMLSRAVSGIYEKTLIINLPGSKTASEQCLRAIVDAMPHAVALIKDEKNVHSQFNSTTNNEYRVPDCVSKIACRYRESPFPKINITSALSILEENSFSQLDKNNRIIYPSVCIFSTGDEIGNGQGTQIRDTNSVMIKQILAQDNYMGKVFLTGVAKDNWIDLCKMFENAFENADIIVTSGGVSMGEKDLIKHVLREHFNGDILFGRVDMKPGMPTTFVTLCFKNKKKYVFSLPGNPVSAGVCTHLFLLPYLRIISSRKSITHSFKAKLTHSINELDIRPEYRRALLKYEEGKLYVSCLNNHQQSSRLLSFVGCNCLLKLPSASTHSNVKENMILEVILIKPMENSYVAPFLNKPMLNMKLSSNQSIMLDQTSIQLSISVKDVFNLMTNHILSLKTENIPTIDAMGYVLHKSIYSPENLPNFPASIKDGYAIKYNNNGSWSQKSHVFRVIQISVAGTELKSQKEIIEGTCCRISTGAPLPLGANCVIPIENTSIVSKSKDEKIELSIAVLEEPKLFDNIRSIGSDISVGQLLIDEKTELGPFEIALLRSVGCEEVSVYRYPTIYIIQCCNTCLMWKILSNILILDGFKGKTASHTFSKNSNNLPAELEKIFTDYDIVIVCGKSEIHVNTMSNVEMHINVNNNDPKISFEYGVVVSTKRTKSAFFHIKCCDIDSINEFDCFINNNI
ncbi:Hypothetical protein CINCED_3A010848 [Cinara cedri]|uniref:MoaB/Mog domain-containing protein n=1 Tax=Cinara cedri TaxID=506608 RepID=A0A5E4LZX0_9HEMI|nr:Hypothetical protein CINCED_3A010848 [Cinara cedri]